MAEKVALGCRVALHRLRGLDWHHPGYQVGIPLWALTLSVIVSCRGPFTGEQLWTLLMMISGSLALYAAYIWPGVANWILGTVTALLGLVTCMWSVQNGFARTDFINPNWIASVLIISLPFASHWIYALFGLLALVFTFSRGAWLALLVAFLALILWSYYRAGTLSARWLVLALIGVAAATLLAMAARPSTVLTRLETWRAACSLWIQRPFLGWGPGASRLLLHGDHADSLLVTVLLEQGALGLLAIVWLGVAVTRLCFGPQGTPARLALLAFMIHQTIDATIYMPGTAMLAGAALALLVLHHETQ